MEPKDLGRQRKDDGTPDPGAAEGNLDDLEAQLRDLIHKLGCGGWRVADDLIDLVQQRVENRLMDEGRLPPTNLVAFACTILRNLTRKRPPARLRRADTDCLDDGLEVAAPEATESEAEAPGLEALLELIEKVAVRILTEPELKALRAILGAESIHKAADAAGMTARDFRIRRDRAVEKLKKFLRGSRPPPPFKG